MNDAVVMAEHGARRIDDLAGPRRIGAQLFNDAGVAAFRHKADVLAVRLVGRDEIEIGGQRAHRALLHVAQRKTQIIELRLGGGEQEIALVPAPVPRRMQFGAARAFDPADIMARGHGFGAQFAGGIHQVGELHFLVAADTGDRRFAARIGVGEIRDHGLAEAAFIIEHIMRNADGFGHALGVVDVLARAAGAFLLLHRVGIKLQGHAHHVMAFALQKRGGERGIHAARHGGDRFGDGENALFMRGYRRAADTEPQRKAVQPPETGRYFSNDNWLSPDVTCSAACKAVWFKDNWVAAVAMLVS